LQNLLLLAAELVLYFVAMAWLFRMRDRFGIGVFVCALGTMHFLETYLAAILYLQLPFGILISPGSTVLFTGKLIMLLMVYVCEDAATARQPIYGLLFGNLLMVALVFLLRHHDVAPIVPGRAPDFGLMDEMGWLMVWGTVLLFIDALLIILLYEHSAAWLGDRRALRIWASAACVLTFDQVGFYAALHLFIGAPASVLFGGWAAKMATAIPYSLLCGIYLKWFTDRAADRAASPRLSAVLDALTYRRRYQDLLEQSGRDPLTGTLNRGRFEAEAKMLLEQASADARPLSLLVIDVDHFKSVNDRYGHAAGDQALKRLAEVLSDGMRQTDRLVRYGGDEFVMLCPDLTQPSALKLAERLRAATSATRVEELGEKLTVSIGVAAFPEDGTNLETLFACADARLYRAKMSGRNCTWSGEYVPWLRSGDPRGELLPTPQRQSA
jgi:diguanylate cyclase (GGDEF)-like protein